MELIPIYKCLSDPTRLRILNLLRSGPLCVCQLQEILDEPQVKTSKHLGYMKEKGLLECERKANWNFYAIANEINPILKANLEALEEYSKHDKTFSEDLRKLQAGCDCSVTISS